MIINRFVILAAALAGLLLFPNAYSATKVYKWTDASGEVHYGETPPDPKKAQLINVHAGPARDQDSGNAESKSAGDKPQAPQDEASKLKQENDKVVKENCTIYKQNLSALKNSARIREKDDKGNYRYLTDEEKAQRMKDAENYIKENCQ